MIFSELPPNTLTHSPTIDPTSFIAPGAQVMGDVTVRNQASIWYNAVIRGDINAIVIGERSNIQDGCVLHVENTRPCVVGNDVTVGHTANLHACQIEDACLIGIGAIVLSGAVIGRGSIIGAGTLILEKTVIPPFSLVVGSPGRIIRQHTSDTIDINTQWAAKYVQLAALHHKLCHHDSKKHTKRGSD